MIRMRPVSRRIAMAIGACATAVGLPSLAREGDIPSALVGGWIVTHAGVSAFRYSFNSDGTYEYAGRMETAPGSNVNLYEAGTAVVQGEYLILKRSHGQITEAAGASRSGRQLPSQTKSYKWNITKDPYVGDRVLWLLTPDGQRQQFYAEK